AHGEAPLERVEETSAARARVLRKHADDEPRRHHAFAHAGVGASNAPVDEQADRTYARYMAELRLATAERVPFVDLEPVHRGLKARILADWGELIDTGAF